MKIASLVLTFFERIQSYAVMKPTERHGSTGFWIFSDLGVLRWWIPISLTHTPTVVAGRCRWDWKIGTTPFWDGSLQASFAPDPSDRISLARTEGSYTSARLHAGDLHIWESSGFRTNTELMKTEAVDSMKELSLSVAWVPPDLAGSGPFAHRVSAVRPQWMWTADFGMPCFHPRILLSIQAPSQN